MPHRLCRVLCVDIARAALWRDDGPVCTAHVVEHAAGVCLVRHLERSLFVDVDAKAGFVVRPHVAISDSWHAGEYLGKALRVLRGFLDTEVVHRKVKVKVRGDSNW